MRHHASGTCAQLAEAVVESLQVVAALVEAVVGCLQLVVVLVAEVVESGQFCC